ncbi:MAG: PAS domain S-box protein [Desulfobacteraceae bacterium]|nr:PAS domain S-box protein [Desulfobacteraceae bacterium]
MIFNSLKSRIIISITGIVVTSLAITIFFFEQRVKQELSDAIETNAFNSVGATRNYVELQHKSILYHKTVMLTRRKIELKNNTTIAFSIIMSAFHEFKNGEISEEVAKRHAIEDLRQLRYDDGIGYFWINDTGLPYPRMIMHPTIPELEGTILDDPGFNCAFGRKENLFKAFVDVCLEKGEGYVDYLWPKPAPVGLTEQRPKESYVKLFEPWNWIVGTGVYIDDIEKDVQARLDAVIEDLNKAILKQRIGEEGYFFIFDEENQVLAHPNRAGMDGNQLVNPITGNTLLDEMKETAFRPDPVLEYLWDKPGHEGEFRFWKKAYVTYYEPLGWYIGSTVYREEFEHKISKLINAIMLFSGSVLLVTMILSLLVSRSITKSLNLLVHSIRQTGRNGIPIITIPETGTAEIKVLGATMNTMIDSVSKSRKALQTQRDFSLGIINGAPYLICGLDSDGIITFINPAGEAATGYCKEELIGKNWWKLFCSDEEYERAKELFKEFARTEVADYEMRLTCKNGEQKIIVWNTLAKKDENNGILEVIGFGHDITERKQAEEELHLLRNYLSNIIDSMPSVLVGVNAEGKVTQWNKTAEQATGIKAAAAHGKNLSDVFPQMASEKDKIAESIRVRETKQEQKKPRLTEKGTCYEDVTIYPLIANGVEGAVIRIDDVTEKVRMEEMMVQSEKMLSVGGLAAGMAHEINNPLAGMMQTADVMSRRLGERADMPANRKAAEAAGTTMEAIRNFMEARGIPRMITTIIESGRRLAAIVDNMLSFARKSDTQVYPHALEELMDKTLDLAATDYDLRKHYDFKLIEIRREYEKDLPLVPCEGAKIQQVLLNILRNGAQAMEAAAIRNPRIILRTWFEKERNMVCMELEDNGPGMVEETRKRVFEPFYTTKPVGVGTGLGLSVSYFIITEDHCGEMAVESRPGAGAKFIIRLPLKGRKPGPVC